MTKQYEFSLEEYTGHKSRHECPMCHDKYSFVYYLNNETGQMVGESVGRCNHESSCGYHYTPKQYFQNNPERKESSAAFKRFVPVPPQQQEPGEIPEIYLSRSIGYKSYFVTFLCSLFGYEIIESPAVERLTYEYNLGYTDNGSVIYWQVDMQNRVRTGKIMQYDPATGKRIKDITGTIDWVHSRLKRDKALPDNFNLVQCLFGEHLLAKYPDKIVALVEGEKSAVIGAGVFPQYVWLATGGKSQLSTDKISVLRNRTVLMFPDVDAYDLWREKAHEMETMGINVMVSDILEKNATQADRDNKIDIADWLIQELRVTSDKSNLNI